MYGKKIATSVAVLFCLAVGVGGCDRSGAGSGGTSQPGESRTAQDNEAKAELAALLADPALVSRSENATIDDVAAVVAANNTFAGRFFATLPDDENIVFSAHSISSALNLTLAGARGQTGDEIVSLCVGRVVWSAHLEHSVCVCPFRRKLILQA